MSSFSICRVVGNELPPRDVPGTKLECLKYIAEIEKLDNVHRVWIINHIIDENYKAKVLDILKNEEVHEIIFDHKIYQKQNTWSDKIKYSVNINAARNFGIKLCQKRFDYVACLDQDCYFWPAQWDDIVSNIESDTNKAEHYGLISKRFHFNFAPRSIEDLNNLIDEEPMIMFSNTTKFLFDESIKFGDNEKNKLLWKLGIEMKKPENKVQFNNGSKCAGYVMHIGFGDEKIETNMPERVQARKQGLEGLLSTIDKKHTNKRKFL